MENKINVAEILKDCPEGMELDCTMYDDLVFVEVDLEAKDYPITTRLKNGTQRWFTSDGRYELTNDAKCVIFPKGKTTWEGFVPPREFKDGDVLVHTREQGFIMSIYHERITEFRIKTHCILWDKDKGLSVDLIICCRLDKVRLATEEEKQKLFDAIKANDYKWNAETKTLEKLIEPKFKVGDRIRHKVTNKNDVYEISKVYDDSYGLVGFTWMLYMKYQDQYELVPNKFDITTLKPFDKVLVRQYSYGKWEVDLFGFYYGGYYHTTGSCPYRQCIPYEENEHLLGKTDDCDEYYKIWEN